MAWLAVSPMAEKLKDLDKVKPSIKLMPKLFRMDSSVRIMVTSMIATGGFSPAQGAGKVGAVMFSSLTGNSNVLFMVTASFS